MNVSRDKTPTILHSLNVPSHPSFKSWRETVGTFILLLVVWGLGVIPFQEHDFLLYIVQVDPVLLQLRFPIQREKEEEKVLAPKHFPPQHPTRAPLLPVVEGETTTQSSLMGPEWTIEKHWQQKELKLFKMRIL